MRNLEDKKLNTEGKKLKNCNEIGGKIKNGGSKGDWRGGLTYVGDMGHSVLDLVIEIETEGISIIDEVRVITRTELDHLPVAIYLEENSIEAKIENDRNRERMERKLVWDESKRGGYWGTMKEKGRDITIEGMNTQDRWGQLYETIWETGKELGLVREGKG
ncbi:hypothetical protein TSAR_013440 [Trichomalopsis sarcophagae]|uniref:Endonuclease/exonuclease/phosphatase domain-containing protein n=1 Tax=Trichomalopsis sarcophagae TaxID=543379 RepID=A0A232EMN9_9HYME|nr:hypothetical protein TSAR_013440 [Trichomalopsis sarcophagae]